MTQTETQATAQETEETNAAAADATEQTTTTDNAEAEEAAPADETEEISYHAVEKEGHVTAIWEMQGRKHLRTIDPRSREGKHILSLFTSEHHEDAAA